jgi:hypothetical protein
VRRPESYARRKPTREPYDSVLIVCEGEKTEPNYLTDLRADYRLSNAKIRITSSDGTDPVSIVRYTESVLARERFDRAYCVFDRDGHSNYEEALQIVRTCQSGRAGLLRAITSVPCFEIWLLLHFAYSSAPFNKAGKLSACDQVLRELRKHIAEYGKGLPGLYGLVSQNTQRAITHAERLVAHNLQTRSNNPATLVHEMVRYLSNLKPN